MSPLLRICPCATTPHQCVDLDPHSSTAGQHRVACVRCGRTTQWRVSVPLAIEDWNRGVGPSADVYDERFADMFAEPTS